MYAYKDVLELAGYTTRLYTLLSTLHSLPTKLEYTPSSDTIAFKHLDVPIPSSGSRNYTSDSADSSESESGTNESIILVRDLEFSLKAGAGEHLMITGTNGVGKTATSSAFAVCKPFQSGSFPSAAGTPALAEVHQSPVGRCCTSAYLRGFNPEVDA